MKTDPATNTMRQQQPFSTGIGASYWSPYVDTGELPELHHGNSTMQFFFTKYEHCIGLIINLTLFRIDMVHSKYQITNCHVIPMDAPVIDQEKNDRLIGRLMVMQWDWWVLSLVKARLMSCDNKDIKYFVQTSLINSRPNLLILFS